MLLFITLLGSIYLFVQLFLWYVWYRSANISIQANDLPELDITILIPIRDEADHIEACLKAVLQQNFTKGQIEIIVVDDHSTDDSAAKVRQFSEVTYFLLPSNQTGKKSAIEYGVAQANGEIILTLDGDCLVDTEWLTNMVGGLIGKSADVVTGPIALQAGSPHFIPKYQLAEQAAMNTITAAGIRSKLFYSSNGANMAFYKATFEELNPYDSNQQIASGDDVFLMHTAVKEGKRLAYIKSKRALVYTQAKPNFDTFIEQRLRWSSKSTAYTHWGTKLYLSTFMAHMGAFVLLMVLSTALPSARVYFFYFMIGKSLIDYLYIQTGLWWNKQELPVKDILIATYFQVFYILWLSILLIRKKNFQWKGRTLSSKIQKTP